MSTDEETDMIRETVAKFVDRELILLEPHYLKSRLPGSDHPELSVEQKQRLRTVSKDLGLWGLDAPEDLGGHDLPTRTMAAVHEELGRTCVPFVLPPAGHYAAGMVFLPPEPEQVRKAMAAIEAIAADEGVRVLGWREVPTDASMLGQGRPGGSPIITTSTASFHPDSWSRTWLGVPWAVNWSRTTCASAGTTPPSGRGCGFASRTAWTAAPYPCSVTNRA